MNISEVKAMAPEADVYTLTPDAKYLIILKSNAVPLGMAMKIPQVIWENLGIRAMVMVFPGVVEDPIQIFKDDE